MADQEIVQGFLRGNKRDYRTIVGWMKEVAANHVWLDTITPDDVISAASERLFLNLRSDKFKYESSLKTYVQRMTRYLIIDLVRSYKRAQHLMTAENLRLPETETPHQIYENKEEAFLFSKILAMMGEKCRELWNMILIGKMTYNEIAVRLGMKESAIKAQVGRCKEEAMKIHARLA